ncbi:protein OS-9-like protein [Hibiscus syriacus]|uniref:Protein OS-9-like protein n=1 Tax=Hibiscus syriacus TaxID=106335 RepID=A0A6A3BVB5_HIBSY|nr:protein OS-9-like protein [Hibiscus syriacus]
MKQNKVGGNSSKSYDSDTAVFIAMSRELKEEGNKLFRKGDLEGAMVIYEKALKLLPKNHIDVCHLRTNIAACYMQMGLSEYPKAVLELNLALEVTPKYSKALVKRARCYESLNRPDLAFRDVNAVLNMEPNNTMALEISQRVRSSLEKQGLLVELPLESIEPQSASQALKVVKEKTKNKKRINEAQDNKVVDRIEEKKVDENVEEKKAEEKYVETPSASQTSKVVEEKSKKKISEPQDDKAVDRIKEKKVDENVEEKRAEDKYVEPPSASQTSKVVKAKTKKKKKISEAQADKVVDRIEEKKVDENVEEKKAEDKQVVEEKISSKMEEPKKSVKLIMGEDIIWAQLPPNCSLVQLREVIYNRFPSSRAILVKYRDEEGDLVTITSDEELRLAEIAAESQGSLRLYVVEVDSKQDPFFERFKRENGDARKVMENREDSCCIDDWIIEFAQLFRNYVGLDLDTYLNLHELGTKQYSEAMEDTVTSDEAQNLFDMAAQKFQEMAALALFDWGNVHMSRARKRVYVSEDGSRESILEQIKTTYDYAQLEYSKAGKRYEEALRTKPDFYEAHLALGQQQFEQAKLSWYYAITNNVDRETWPSENVLHLYNNAEENMERGMQMWEELERQRLHELSDSNNEQIQLKKIGSNGFLKDISADEAAEQTINMSAMINLLWGTILYERSIMEFKLGLPVWHECLEVAIEKFEHAGVSPTDIAVMVKNHCSNNVVLEGLGFKIDEIIQAWNEMYEAKRWNSKIQSHRLEPLLRRRVSNIYHVLEHA